MIRSRLGLVLLALPAMVRAEDVTVHTTQALREGLSRARPGQVFRVEPGQYEPFMVRGVRGEAERPIVIRAADPARPPVFQGGSGVQLSGVSHLEVHDLVLAGASGNGLNIDDAGDLAHPSHHVLLKNIHVRDVGPTGNHDGIKLSGLDDFQVEGCTVERWGSAGSGIDMVGCHRGLIVGCTFRHGDTVGDHGVQTKGGTAEVTIRGCRFEHAGQRAVNLGGSTGLAFFRPQPPGHAEARDITVEDCTFVGSQAPIAFVGVDGATVHHNTIVRPARWAIRILQETRAPGFAPCRRGRFTHNLVVFRSGQMVGAANVGDGTDPTSFVFDRNVWTCEDAPARSRPQLPTAETDGRYGVEPGFVDAAHGDYRLRTDSPAREAGARNNAWSH